MNTRYFAHYNTKNGRLIGIYDTASSSVIPVPSVEITQEENDKAQIAWQKGQEIYVTGEHLEYKDVFAGDISTIKTAKLREINLKADYVLYYLTENYPESEMSSWYKQELEAKLYKMDPVNHPSVLIENIAAARGMDVNDLIDKIILKANMFSRFSGMVFGRRQKYEDDLVKATSITDVEAIVVDFTDIIGVITSNKDVILG